MKLLLLILNSNKTERKLLEKFKQQSEHKNRTVIEIETRLSCRLEVLQLRNSIFIKREIMNEEKRNFIRNTYIRTTAKILCLLL